VNNPELRKRARGGRGPERGHGRESGRRPDAGRGPAERSGDARAGGSLAPPGCQGTPRPAYQGAQARGPDRRSTACRGRVRPQTRRRRRWCSLDVRSCRLCDLACATSRVRPRVRHRAGVRPRQRHEPPDVRASRSSGSVRTSIRRADESRVAEHDVDGQTRFRRRNERGSLRSDQQR
jgi:hypothetical protein